MLGDLPAAERVSQAAAEALEAYCSGAAGSAARAAAPRESHPVQHAAVELQRTRLALCHLSSRSGSLLLRPAMLWGGVSPAGGTADLQPEACSAKLRGRKGAPAKRAAAECDQQQQRRILEEYLWRLLPCHQAVQQVPLLFRSAPPNRMSSTESRPWQQRMNHGKISQISAPPKRMSSMENTLRQQMYQGQKLLTHPWRLLLAAASNVQAQVADAEVCTIAERSARCWLTSAACCNYRLRPRSSCTPLWGPASARSSELALS